MQTGPATNVARPRVLRKIRMTRMIKEQTEEGRQDREAANDADE